MAERLPQFGDRDTFDEDVLARLAGLQVMAPDQAEELADLQRQFEELMAARESLALSPAQAQEQYAALMAQIRAQQAMHQMTGLSQFLQSESERLEQMRQLVAGLRQETEGAAAQQLEGLSGQQQELDPEAIELIRRAQELLAQRLERMQRDRDLMPPAPWVPPGRREQAMPVEADTPEEDPAEEGKGPDLAAARQRLEDLEAMADENWWDRAVDVPPTPFTLDPNDRFANRDTRPTEAPTARMSNGLYTPRRMLMDHQDQLYQALTANSNQVAARQGQVSQMMSQLEQAMMPMAGANQQVSGGQLQQMLGSQGFQQMMAMAGRAAMQSYQAGRMRTWSPTGSTYSGEARVGFGPARPGMVLNIDLDALGVPAAQGAALYRLPPWLRQPLVEGMQERGPEAYQPLIDAYYRQLSDAVEASGGALPEAPAPPPAPKPKTEQPKASAPKPKTEQPKAPAPKPKAE